MASASTGGNHGRTFAGTTACLPPPLAGTFCCCCFYLSILHMALLFILFLDLMKPKQVKIGGVVT